MLEKYSKAKAFMFVRKRKAARKKRKQEDAQLRQGSMPLEYGGEEEVDSEADREAPTYAEHAFTFASFEKV